jgi:acyl carrier protein
MDLIEDIQTKVIDTIKQMDLPNMHLEKLNEHTDLADELGLDSIQFTYLIIRLEEVFDIEIEPELLLFENFSTPHKISELMGRICEDERKPVV